MSWTRQRAAVYLLTINIEVSGKTYNVKATVTTGEERAQLYELFKAQGRNFVEYEKKTARKILVIRLQPIAKA